MDKDPWYWSEDDVSLFWRSKAQAFLANDGKLPDPEAFAQVLKENDIRGSVLLDEIDDTFLKDECGLRKLGARHAVKFCLRKLRDSSPRYCAVYKKDTPSPEACEALARLVAPNDTNIRVGEHAPRHEVATISEPNGQPASKDTLQKTVTESPRPSVHAQSESEIPPTNSARKHARTEEQIVDEGGKKRRKLTLGSPIQQTPSPTPPAAYSEEIEDGPMRYMRDKAFLAEEIFYGSTRLGAEIQDFPNHKGISVEGEEDHFQFAQQPIRDGDRHYVYSRLRHFWSKAREFEVRERGRTAIAIQPYPDRLVPTNQYPPATVFQFKGNDNEVSAIRENAAFVQSGLAISTDTTQPGPSAEEWDFLRDKYKDDDEIVSVLGDSASIGSSLAEEIEKEQADNLRRQNSKLSRDRISELFEGYVETFIDAWKKQHVARLEEKKAWAVWKIQGGGAGAREKLIEDSERKIVGLEDRLTSYKADILRNEYTKDSQVQAICEIAEATLEDREQMRWNISVWKRDQEPEHAIAVPRAPRTNRRSLKTPASSFAENGLFAERGSARVNTAPMPPALENEGAEDHDRMELDNDVTSIERNDEAGHESDHEDGFVVDDSEDMRSVAPAADDDDGNEPRHVHLGPDEPVTSIKGRPSLPRSSQREEIDLITPVKAATMVTPKKLSASFSPNELPSPSQFVQKRFKREKQPESSRNFVDLTSSRPSTPAEGSNDQGSNDQGSLATLLAMPFKAQLVQCRTIQDAPVELLGQWTYDMLIGARQWDRVLWKALADLGPEYRDELYECIQDDSAFEAQLSCALDAYVENDPHPESLDASTEDTMMTCARLYEAWWAHRSPRLDGLFTDELPLPSDPSSAAAKKWGKRENTRYAKKPLLDAGNFYSFHKLLHVLLSRKDTGLFLSSKERKLFANRIKSAQPSTPINILSDNEDSEASVQATSPNGDAQNPIGVSDESDTGSDGPGAPRKMTPAKQLRKQVKQNAKKKVANALARQKRFQAAKESQEDSQTARGVLASEIDEEFSIAINPMEPVETQHVIHPLLAKKLKPHQVDGVRSMWREITADASESESQGCVLAHTMGLGKTMQAVALLVALTEAARSKNKDIVAQLPPHLRWHKKRPPRMMVLCPPNIITNWLREIETWSCKNLDPVISIEAGLGQPEPTESLEYWYKLGGLLVIGHSLFRSLLSQNSDKKAKPSRYDKDTIARIYKMLLEGPDIVIMDEAQAIKNKNSSLTQLAHRLETPSRVALTGTPMSNNLGEAFALVNWVAPGYLGDEADFRDRYQGPIEAAGFADATYGEVRKGNKRLHILWHQIAPKVNRADITVMKGALPPKVEFLVTVPLTEVQDAAYRKFVQVLLTGRNADEQVGQTTLFSWLATLALLTNHPFAYREKLKTPKYVASKAKKGKTRQEKVTDDTTEIAVDGAQEGADNPEAEHEAEQIFDVDMYTLGFKEDTVVGLLEDLTSSLDQSLSAKTAILTQILQHSEAVKDKVLIFSQSLPTLRYLKQLLSTNNTNYAYIDGSVTMSDRFRILEEFKHKQHDVILISTRAGGVGFNMQTANRVIIMDSGFNPAWEEQAIGRAYRMGQQKAVFVYRFVAGGTFEKKLYDQQIYKTSLSKKVVDKKNSERHTMKSAGAEWLFEPKDVPQQDVDVHLGLDEQVMDKLIRNPDCQIRALTTFETLLRGEEHTPDLTPEEKYEVDQEIALNEMRKIKRPNLEGGAAPSTLPTNLAQTAFAANPAGMPNLLSAAAARLPSTAIPAGSTSVNGLPDVSRHFQAPPASTMPATGVKGLLHALASTPRVASKPTSPSFPEDDVHPPEGATDVDGEQETGRGPQVAGTTNSSPVNGVSNIRGEDADQDRYSSHVATNRGGADEVDADEGGKNTGTGAIKTPIEIEEDESDGEDSIPARRPEPESPSAGRMSSSVRQSSIAGKSKSRGVWHFWR
ncbi:hypothetical protein MBLNU230_g2210t1 [Neophaeotheca triangularis]